MTHMFRPLGIMIAALLAGSAQAAPSSVALAVSSNPARFGSQVTLAASVAPTSATGEVTFYQGVSVLGTASVVSGTATFTTTLLAFGGAPLKAHYAGDANFSPSTSTPVPMVVNSVAAQGFQFTFQLEQVNLQFPVIAVSDFNGDGKLDVAATTDTLYGPTLIVFPGQGNGTFTLGQSITGIPSVTSIVAADFNGDGKTDLGIMANASLYVLAGNGDGSFQPAVNYPVPGERLVTGDFNGDGIIDIAVTSGAYANGGVSILLGRASGGFAPAVSLPVASGGGVIVAADVNGDGVADLIVQEGTSSFQVYLGKGNGTFAALGSPVAMNNQISDIAAGDFNADRKPDLIVSNGAGVSLLLGNGDGTFGPPKSFAVGQPTQNLAVTDVNGDGKLDVIVGTGYPPPLNGPEGTFAVLLGDGAGSLELSAFHDNFGAGGPFVIGDFNGDGRVDIVEALGGLIVYLGLAPTNLTVTLTDSGNFVQGQSGAAFTATVGNLGPGTTVGALTLSFSLPAGLTLVRASGTGWSCTSGGACMRSDPLAPGVSFPPVTLTVNVSSAAPPALIVTATASTAGTSDPNPANDTASDTVAVVQYQSIIFGTLQDVVIGAPPFTLAATATSGLPVSYAASGNCTVSGAVVTVTAAGSCSITASQAGNSLYMPAANVMRTFTIGVSATSVTLTVAPTSSMFGAPVTLAATVSPPAAQGRVAFYDGATLLGSATLAQGTATLVLRSAGTGNRRIFGRYLGTAPWPGSVSAPANLTVVSTPSFNFTPVTPTENTYFNDLAAGDFNRDGNVDVIAVSSFYLVVFPGDGAGHFGSPVQTNIASTDLIEPRIAVGDFNGDGNLDVAVATSTLPTAPQSVSVWFGRGNGTFTQGPVFQIPGISIAVADFNGDGFADLAIGYGPTPGVAVLISNGDGTFEAPINYAVSGDQINYATSGGRPPALLATADLNQDGVPDLIAVTGVANAGGFNNRISVLLGNGDGTFLQAAGWVDDPVSAFEGIGAIAVGDINGDYAPDLVIQNNQKDITVLAGNGDGTFQPPEHLAPSVSGMSAGVIVADFTGDGKADIAALYTFNQGFLQVFPGNGDGTFQGASAYQYAVNGMSAFSAADFNGDGRMDIAVAGIPASVTVLEGAPGPALHAGIELPAVVTGLAGQTTTITIANASGATPTTGVVTVTGGLTPSSDGAGWSCAGPIISCTRSDALPGGSSFPTIVVQMQPSFNPVDVATAAVQVSGGGSPPSEAFASAPALPNCNGCIAALITSVNTVSAASFAGISPNDWIEIHGINLVPATTPAGGVIWNNAPDFAAGKMPTQLAGVSVSVDGAPSYVYFFCSAATSPACSTDQINVLTPPSLPDVASVIAVTSGVGTVSTIMSFYPNQNTVTPSFLRFGASRYVAATHADYSLIGPAGLYPGASTPAKAGEVVLLWAAGFGLPVQPLTPGSSIQSGSLPAAPVCTVGGHPANVSIALVSPGLYQLNLTVPIAAPSGDNAVTCIYIGAATSDGALLTVQ